MRVLIIPAAGKGSRFAEQGYPVPKPMIRLSTGNIMLLEAMRPFLYHVDVVGSLLSTSLSDEQVARINEHVAMSCAAECDLAKANERTIRCTNVSGRLIAPQPLGAALSVLAMQGAHPEDTEVIVANSDQHFDQAAIDRWLAHIDSRPDLDGSILTFSVPDKEDRRWSYVEENDEGYVTRVVEKEHISDNATCGAYYFRSWALLRSAIIRMISGDDRTNGEFYLAPVYNHMPAGALISSFGVGPGEFAGLGTPELLQAWEALQLQRREESKQGLHHQRS